jgi:hypothetical protein
VAENLQMRSIDPDKRSVCGTELMSSQPQHIGVGQFSAHPVAGEGSGRPDEFHLQSPTEPCVNLSIHTAPASFSLVASRLQADAGG